MKLILVFLLLPVLAFAQNKSVMYNNGTGEIVTPTRIKISATNAGAFNDTAIRFGTNSGLYWSGAPGGGVGIADAGVDMATFDSGLGIFLNRSVILPVGGNGDILLSGGGKISVGNGSITDPAFTFNNELQGGMYYDSGTPAIHIAINGTDFQFAESGTFTAPFLAGDGFDVSNLDASKLAQGVVPIAQLQGIYEPNAFFGDFQDNGGVNYYLKGFETTLRDKRKIANMTLQRTLTSLGVTNGVSGATYNARTGTIFILFNQSAGVGGSYELSQDGTLLRTITHANFNDTEAIEWCGSIIGSGTGTLYDVFAIAEEDESTAGTTNPGLQRISLVLLTATGTTFDRTATNGTDPDNVSENTVYSGGNIDNNGLENIAYDQRHRRLYYTAEFRTAANNPSQTGTAEARIWFKTCTISSSFLGLGGMSDAEKCVITPLFSGTLTDIGDMAYDYMSDTILLLSDQSDKVVRINQNGAVIETLATPGNQPEGLAISPDGSSLWVTGENQEFYRYSVPENDMTPLLQSRTYPSSTASFNVQTGTTYTLVAGDNGKIITMNNAGAITLTVPSGLPDGFSCRVIQLGAGTVTPTASGTTLNGLGGAVASPGQYGALWIQERPDAANSFVVVKLNQ